MFEAEDTVKKRFLTRHGRYGHLVELMLHNDKVVSTIKKVVSTSPDYNETKFHYPLFGNVATFKNKVEGMEETAEFQEIFDYRESSTNEASSRIAAKYVGEEAKVVVEFSVYTWNIAETGKKTEGGKKPPTGPGCREACAETRASHKSGVALRLPPQSKTSGVHC